VADGVSNGVGISESGPRGQDSGEVQGSLRAAHSFQNSSGSMQLGINSFQRWHLPPMT
jgi:hypothetical protein